MLKEKRELLIKNDKNVPLPNAFIKLCKKKYSKKYLDEGAIRFSSAQSYRKDGKENLVYDKFEGYLYYPISNLHIAPLINEEENTYGEPILISQEAKLRSTYEKVSCMPVHCLMSYKKETINTILRLDNYDEIRNGFPDYDTAIIILYPCEFLKRLSKNNGLYVNSVIYTDRTPLESEIENIYHYLFYKRTNYRNQNEFRIVLASKESDVPIDVCIGSIRDIAFEIPLDYLKKGIVIAEEDKMDEVKKSVEGMKGIKIGDKITL